MLCYLFNFQVFHVDGMLIINLYQIWKHFIYLTGLTIEEKNGFGRTVRLKPLFHSYTSRKSFDTQIDEF